MRFVENVENVEFDSAVKAARARRVNGSESVPGVSFEPS
jgi:hypothetical protein